MFENFAKSSVEKGQDCFSCWYPTKNCLHSSSTSKYCPFLYFLGRITCTSKNLSHYMVNLMKLPLIFLATWILFSNLATILSNLSIMVWSGLKTFSILTRPFKSSFNKAQRCAWRDSDGSSPVIKIAFLCYLFTK